MNRPLAHDFLLPRDFVGAFDVWAQSALRGYSRRAFARWAQISSPNFLTLVIQGKRSLAGEWLEGFVKAAKLDRAETEHLRLLAQLEKSRDLTERTRILDEIHTRLRKRGTPSLVADRLEILRRPLALTLYHMMDLGDAEVRAVWFKKRLRLGKTNASEIQDLLELLERLGLARQDDDGRWHSVEKTLESPDQVRKAENVAYHSYVLGEAREALENVDPAQRSFGSLTVTVPTEKIEDLKAEVNRFGRHLMNTYAKPGPTDGEVVRVNVQLYPLTVRDTGGSKS